MQRGSRAKRLEVLSGRARALVGPQLLEIVCVKATAGWSPHCESFLIGEGSLDGIVAYVPRRGKYWLCRRGLVIEVLKRGERSR
jgi:hypothetical protein